ncbi:MAG TPA: TlpA family protein disulfide reductase [Flavobacteriaceae bacterium]|nr:TlpA family protein disulfide reductase [Flavobacteriaceae bacterium]
MKNIKLLLIILLIQTTSLFAQNYSFISKDLHLMSEKEMMDNQVVISGDIPMYNINGDNIEPSQINDLMSSGNFIPVVFGDKNFKAKAIVFRKTTKEEKEEMLKAMSMRDPNANFVAGQMANDFIAYDIDGNKISLKSLKGKIVVLNFWFTQCRPCVVEMPKLNELVKKYKDVVFISITFDKKDVVKKFLSNREFNYSHITGNETILSDYNVSTFPTHIIIDQKGEIILRKVGDFIKEMDIKLDLLLKK